MENANIGRNWNSPTVLLLLFLICVFSGYYISLPDWFLTLIVKKGAANIP